MQVGRRGRSVEVDEQAVPGSDHPHHHLDALLLDALGENLLADETAGKQDAAERAGSPGLRLLVEDVEELLGVDHAPSDQHPTEAQGEIRRGDEDELAVGQVEVDRVPLRLHGQATRLPPPGQEVDQVRDPDIA